MWWWTKNKNQVKPSQPRGITGGSYNYSKSMKRDRTKKPAAKKKYSFPAFVEQILLRFEVYRHKNPTTFEYISFASALFFQALYVYTMYVDVRVIQSLFDSGHDIPAALTITFLITHNVVLALLLLSYFRSTFLEIALGKGSWNSAWITHQDAASRLATNDQEVAETGFGPVWKVMKTQHFGKLLLIPPTFLVGFMLCIISIPILDLMVIGFEAFSFLLEAKKKEELDPPLQWHLFNFLLQYSTIRSPLQGLLQSLPQTFLQLALYIMFRDDPNEQGSSGTLPEIIQAMSVAAFNVVLTGIILYLTKKLSGQTFARYIRMALQFQGAAALPPSWVERWIESNLIIDGNYSQLKLAQQMKLLQAAVRRDYIALITPRAGPASVVPFHWRESMIPDAAKGHDLRRMIHARSTIVLEHRKIIEFLYFLNRETGVRRFPSKICEVAVYRQQVNVNVNFVKLHELPPRPIKDSGTDFDISVKQLMANMEAWPTQKLALKLIGNQNVMHNLLHVSLVDCNLTAFYIYGEGDGEGDGAGHGGEPPISPLLELLESESIQTLDLSNNPLFVYDPDVAHKALDRMADARLHASLREKQLTYEDQSKAYRQKNHNLGSCTTTGSATITGSLSQPSKSINGRSAGPSRWTLCRPAPLPGTEAAAPSEAVAAYDAAELKKMEEGRRKLEEEEEAVRKLKEAERKKEKEEAKWNVAEDTWAVDWFCKALKNPGRRVWEKKVTPLKVLRLSLTGLQEEGSLKLFDSVPSTLKLLDVSHNNLYGQKATDARLPKDNPSKLPKIHVLVKEVYPPISLSLDEVDLSSSFPGQPGPGNGQGGDMLTRIIRDSSRLWKVDLSNNDTLKDKGLKALGDALIKSGASIKYLVLRSMQINHSGMAALRDAIGKSPKLTALDLSENDLGTEGARQLADALAEVNRNKFEELVLSGCFIKPDGISYLCSHGLKGMTSLTALDLSHNGSFGFSGVLPEGVDDKGDSWTPATAATAEVKKAAETVEDMVYDIGEVLANNQKMQHLSFAKMQMHVQAAIALAGILGGHSPQGTERLVYAPQLKTLNLGNNPLGADGAVAIAVALAHHPELFSLSLAACNITTSGFDNILLYFRENKMLAELDLTRNFIQNIDLDQFRTFNLANNAMHRLDLRWNCIPKSICGEMKGSFTNASKEAARLTFASQLQDLISFSAIYREEDPYQLLM